MKRFNAYLLICGFLLFIGCNKKKEQEAEVTDISILKENTDKWNNANSQKDLQALSVLYADSVLYYGQMFSRNQCIENKRKNFTNNPDFYQQIFGEINTEKIDSLSYKVSFVKRVTLNNKTEDFPSYLIFNKSAGKWVITTEGDLVTDKNLSKAKIPENAVKGDFNGDGINEYMWLTEPELIEDDTDCKGACNCYITFSDKTIPNIKIENCIGGIPDNLGDLNKNGSDEIGLLPNWFASCWRSYYVWAFKNGKWVYAVDPIETHCVQWEQGIEPIGADPKKEGYVIVRYSGWDNDNITIKTKSVKIIK